MGNTTQNCYKKNPEGSRNVAGMAVISFCSVLFIHPPLSSSDNNCLSDSMTAYIMLVLAGLAGSPRMASATLQALARLLYDFHGKGLARLLYDFHGKGLARLLYDFHGKGLARLLYDFHGKGPARLLYDFHGKGLARLLYDLHGKGLARLLYDFHDKGLASDTLVEVCTLTRNFHQLTMFSDSKFALTV